MRQFSLVLIFVLAVLIAAGCADMNLAEDNVEFCSRELSGFFWGVWHGFIAPFSFIGSLFDSDIAVYDICNIGGWYDFGFCLGIGAFTKGSGAAADSASSSRFGDGDEDSVLSGWWSAK